MIKTFFKEFKDMCINNPCKWIGKHWKGYLLLHALLASIVIIPIVILHYVDEIKDKFSSIKEKIKKRFSRKNKD